MAHIVKDEVFCANVGCGQCWPRDPVLEVVCPDCRAGIGIRCKRPSGHSGPFVVLHAARDVLTDTLGKYGDCPLGRCGLARQPTQARLPLFD